MNVNRLGLQLGWSSILKMELLSKKLLECTNEFEKIIIQHVAMMDWDKVQEQQKARKNHLKAFYLDIKEDGSVDVKARWLIRVMSNRKVLSSYLHKLQGKKLFLKSYSFFNREIWLELLSYLIPYILIWCQQDKQDDVNVMALRMITEYINSDCKNANLTKIAADTHQSVTVLSKLIKQKTGANFQDLPQQRRFQAAVKLLEETDLSIEDISLDVGYENQSYFFRQFKKRFGMTPRSYRITHQK